MSPGHQPREPARPDASGAGLEPCEAPPPVVLGAVRVVFMPGVSLALADAVREVLAHEVSSAALPTRPEQVEPASGSRAERRPPEGAFCLSTLPPAAWPAEWFPKAPGGGPGFSRRLSAPDLFVAAPRRASHAPLPSLRCDEASQPQPPYEVKPWQARTTRHS